MNLTSRWKKITAGVVAAVAIAGAVEANEGYSNTQNQKRYLQLVKGQDMQFSDDVLLTTRKDVCRAAHEQGQGDHPSQWWMQAGLENAGVPSYRAEAVAFSIDNSGGCQYTN